MIDIFKNKYNHHLTIRQFWSSVIHDKPTNLDNSKEVTSLSSYDVILGRQTFNFDDRSAQPERKGKNQNNHDQRQNRNRNNTTTPAYVYEENDFDRRAIKRLYERSAKSRFTSGKKYVAKYLSYILWR